MSTRRHVNEVVQVFGVRCKILPEDRHQELCARSSCGDPACVEWATLVELDESDNETERLKFHIAECLMATPRKRRKR